MGHEGIWISDKVFWSDPTLSLDAAVYPPLLSAPLSASFLSLLLSYSVRLRLSVFCRHFSFVKLLVFYAPPRYISSCLAHLPPSYLYHPIIYSYLQFTSPLQYFIPKLPPTPSLSISLPIFLSIYLSISPHSLSLSSLSHSLSVSIYFSSTS